MVEPLEAEALRWRCDPALLEFDTTAEIDERSERPQQVRVKQALEFFADMAYPGYNLFALGSAGLGRHSAVEEFLRARAAHMPVPDDICYVGNFEDPQKPRFLSVPRGAGRALQRDVALFIDDCIAGLMTAFESEEYGTRRRIIEEEMNDRSTAAMAEVEKEAAAHDIAMVRTPVGFALAPIRNGEIVKPEQFSTFALDERKAVEARIEAIQERLRQALKNAPAWQKEMRDRIRELNEETARFAVMGLLDALKQNFHALEAVAAYLDELGADVIDQADMFLQSGQAVAQGGPGAAADLAHHPAFRPYRVNLLVDHADSECAPVIYEDNPTYDRLIGAIEHRAEMGTLTTDFTLIRAGALHRANGGYLVIDAHKLLGFPYAWESLKQSLRSREVRITPMERALGLISTQSLEAEPVPLDLKIVLIGPPMLYYMLSQYDPEFHDLFKVSADFDDVFDCTPELLPHYAALLGGIAERNALAPLGAEAIARVMEQAARWSGHGARLSANIGELANLMREADYKRARAGREHTSAEDVAEAIAAARFRAGRIQERMQRETLDDTITIATSGTAVGEINGLSVLMLGGFSFGKPSRISARVALGRGQVVDIEREVELGGPLHTKGVMILKSYLGAHYATEHPLSFNASLVFEQSYGGVDGDSASSTELYCLLSAISGIPLTQAIAVTGSVSQTGQVQAIGGVNEKIEGFFDLCAARGLNGEQGVMIPRANVKHLMLDARVCEAVAAGQFSIYAVETIDEGLEVLSGRVAGARDESGAFPEGSFNHRVAERLAELSEIRFSLGHDRDKDGDESRSAES